MKTKLCRPVLINSKTNTDLWLMHNKSQGLMMLKTASVIDGEPMQLALIDLNADKNFQIGDLIYNGYNIFECDDLETVKNRSYLYKVIAQQPKISENYIQHFIDNYNIGYIENVLIELECPQCKEWGWLDSCRSNCNQQFLQPKLNNGYITTIKA